MRKIGRKIRKFTSDVLDLPQDVIFDLPRLTLIGNMQLYIENHRGVADFSDNLLRLKLSVGGIEITGKQLVIRTITAEEIFVEGLIDHVRFV